MGVLLTAAVLFCVTWALWRLFSHVALRHKLAFLPSSRSYPIIGHGLIVKPDPEGFVDQVMGMAALFPLPRMCLFWLGPVPALMIYSAELAESILSSSKHLNKGFAYNLLHQWLGLSLLTREAAEWRPRRKTLTPTFHYDILKDFVPIFNNHAKILVDKLSKTSCGTSVEMQQLLTLCTLDIICETSMGKSTNAQAKSDSEYVRAIHDINAIIQKRTTNPIYWIDSIFRMTRDGRRHDECLRTLHGFTAEVIKERELELARRDWKLEGRLAFLDLLLHMAHEGDLPREDIQPEVDTFMFEGHDTTSTGLTWAIHLIGNDARVQRLVHEELDAVLTGDEITTEDLGKLKYLECCIKEALRLYPSVPVILRETGCDQVIGGHVIPSGTHVLLNLYLIHRDPTHWKDPELFFPDRFLAENAGPRHAFSFVPFSAGSRNCIGQRFALMEEKTILAWIFRNFSVMSKEKRFEVRPRMDLIMRPEGGINVTLTKRTPSKC